MIFLIVVIGLAVGSFLNVCIYRLPRNESVITPRSHCPECKKTIAWYDNIPVLRTYVLLKGKCRFCKKPISAQYAVVEVLTAVLFAGAFLKWKTGFEFFVYSIFFCGLVVATFVDFKFQIIPDEISYGGMALGLLVSLLHPALHNASVWYRGLFNSFLGLLTGGVLIYLIGIVGKLIFKKEAMGGGDVKFLAMIGAFLGWKYTVLVFFLAPFFGSVVGITMKIRYKAEVIPYGPYLSLAAVVVLFWGDRILGYLF